MKIYAKIVNRITGIVSIISFVGFFFIMAITVCDIIMRYVTGNAILGVYEIVERTMTAAVFASFAYTQRERGHVMITLLCDKYPKVLRFIAMTFNYAVCTVVSVLVAYAAFNQGKLSMESNYTTAILKIPLHPFYWIEVVAMIVLALAFSLDCVRNLAALFNEEIAMELMEEKSGTDSAF